MRAAAAQEALTDALAALRDRDESTPCQRRPERVFGTLEDRQRAAAACEGCPILAVCRSYAESTRQTHGVWGGVDRTPAPPGGSLPGPRGPRRARAAA
jgi:hypothetical protein